MNVTITRNPRATVKSPLYRLSSAEYHLTPGIDPTGEGGVFMVAEPSGRRQVARG
jgi:hypothetical protein